MCAASFDDDIAAPELGVFLDAVACMRQLLAGMGTYQRGIFLIEVNHCVLQWHLQQRFTDYFEDDSWLYGNRLMYHLARYFQRQRENFIRHGLFKLGHA